MSEFALHRYVVELLRLAARPGVLWFHPPNGEYRSKRTGARLKAMGVIAGVADIVLVIDGTAHFLELKTQGGRQSAEQRAFELAAIKAHAPYEVARSPEHARSVLTAWGAIRSTAEGVAGSVVRRAAA